MDSYNQNKNVFDSNILSQGTDIVIALFGREIRGNGLKKYTTYLIKGNDKNGSFENWRRFS